MTDQPHAGWETESPPLDGTPIVAVGRMFIGDENSKSVHPFCVAMFWQAASLGDPFSGWIHYLGDKLSFALTMDDKITLQPATGAGTVHWRSMGKR